MYFNNKALRLNESQEAMMHHNYKDIYIGKLIREKVDESNMSYAEFARQIHCTRSNLYRIFACKSIDIERLILISDVLHYDFIHHVYYAPSDNLVDGIPYVLLPFKDGRVCTEGLPDLLRVEIEKYEKK